MCYYWSGNYKAAYTLLTEIENRFLWENALYLNILKLGGIYPKIQNKLENLEQRKFFYRNKNLDNSGLLENSEIPVYLAEIQFALGIMYYFGLGKPANRELAKKFFKKAKQNSPKQAKDIIQNKLSLNEIGENILYDAYLENIGLHIAYLIQIGLLITLLISKKGSIIYT